MRTIRSLLLGMLALLALMLQVTEAQAVPSFARQTGMDCTTCHMSWLELTNVGRRFKLGGYQLMKAMAPDAERPIVTTRFDENPPILPLAYMLQFSNTRIGNPTAGNTDPVGDFGNGTKRLDNTINMQQFSVFLNGKLADHVGCFCQWTYDDTARHSGIDNAEIRIADDYSSDNFKALYGVAINNNPGMSDIYNTTPVWGWPYIGSVVGAAPTASTVLSGAALGQQSVGVTAYALLNQTFYLELGGYRTADGAFSIFRAGAGHNTEIDGVAPYYRFALQHDWDKGHQSAEIGVFGLTSKIYADATDHSAGTDKFSDTGVDAQYQYITDAHRFSAMYRYIREKQDYTANAATYANTSNTVNEQTGKVSYYYNKWYGVSLGFQKYSGTSDGTLYAPGDINAAGVGGSANGSPDSTARILEFNYLFSFTGEETFRRNRLVVQYTDWSKFNGGTTNYNGTGRNAKDNNMLSVMWWSLY
jgi:hypothetical protein